MAILIDSSTPFHSGSMMHVSTEPACRNGRIARRPISDSSDAIGMAATSRICRRGEENLC